MTQQINIPSLEEQNQHVAIFEAAEQLRERSLTLLEDAEKLEQALAKNKATCQSNFKFTASKVKEQSNHLARESNDLFLGLVQELTR